ncbi:MAG: hypothetical protein AAF224_01620 [Pseudomonadota bacterium]
MESLAGDYRSSELDATYTVSPMENGVFLTGLWMPAPMPLTVSGIDRFDFADWGLVLRFVRDDDGAPVAFMLSSERAVNVRFDRFDSDQ